MPLAGGQLAATRSTVSRDASRPAYLRIPGFIGCNGALDRWTREGCEKSAVVKGRRAGNTRSRNRAPPYRSSQSEIIPCRRLRARVARKEEEEEEVDEEKSLFFGHETPITPKQNNYNEIIDQAQSPRL